MFEDVGRDLVACLWRLAPAREPGLDPQLQGHIVQREAVVEDAGAARGLHEEQAHGTALDQVRMKIAAGATTQPNTDLGKTLVEVVARVQNEGSCLVHHAGRID